MSKNFNPVITPYVAPAPLEVLQNTYNTLEQGHKQAVELKSALQTAFGQLDFNEKEFADGWVQSKIDKIKNTLTDNTTYGNAYGALDDLIALKGELDADPTIKGRLLSQKEYKTFLTTLNNRTDITEREKEYLRNKNTYHYEDGTDSSGNTTMGSIWAPNKYGVSSVDMNKVFATAMTHISPKAGSSNKVMWMDINNNVTDKPTDYAKAVRFNTQTNKYEIVSEEDIKKAVWNTIASDESIRQGLMQEFESEKWRAENDKDTLIKDAKGMLKTFEEYVNSKIDPFAETKAYRHIYSSTDYNDNLAVGLKNLRIASGETTYSNNNGGIMSVPGIPMSYKDETVTQSFGKINAANAVLKDTIEQITGSSAESLGLKGINLLNLDNINSSIDKANISDDQKNKIKNAISVLSDAYDEDLRYYDQILANTNSQEQKNAIIAYSTIMSGGEYNLEEIKESNPGLYSHYKNWTDLVENYFPNGAQYIKQRFTDKKVYEKFIETFGGISAVKNAGIELNPNDNGYYTVKFDKNNMQHFVNFANSVNIAYSNKNRWQQFGNQMKQYFGYGDETYALDENNNKVKTLGMGTFIKADYASATEYGKGIRNVIPFLYYGYRTSFEAEPNNLFSPISRYFNNLSSKASNMVGENKIVQSKIIPGVTPTEIQLYQSLNNPNLESDELTRIKKQLDLSKDNVRSLIQSGDFLQTPTYIYDEDDHIFVKASDEELKDMKDNMSASTEIVSNMSLDFTTGRYIPQFTFKYKNNKDKVVKSYTIRADKFLQSEQIDALNNDPYLNASSKLITNAAANKDTRIDIGEADDKMYLRSNGINYDRVYANSDVPIDSIDADKAINMIVNREMLNAVMANPSAFNKDDITNIITSYITTMYGGNLSEDQLMLLYENITKNINIE